MEISARDFLDIPIYPCVVNVPIQPMTRMERAVRGIFRYCPLTQNLPVQPKIQVYHHKLNFNLARLVLFSAYVITRMRAYDIIKL